MDRGLWISLGALGLILTLLISLVALPRFAPNQPQYIGRDLYPIVLVPRSTTGNPTSGWTYAITVSLTPSLERPNLVWADLTVVLIDETVGIRYAVPAGTTLRVVSSTQGTVAEYEFPSQTWWMGAAAAVEDQQVLMLHGMIPPGEAVIQRSVGSFHGVGFFLVYSTGVSTGVDLQ